MANLSTVLSWPGNKRLLAKEILKYLPTHRTYVEPFGGALGVFLAKERSEVEVINDIDGDLIGFYRVVKHHPEEIIVEIKLVLHSRQEFLDYQAQPGLTDIQRGARWYLVNKSSFGGLGGHFGTSKARSAPSRLALAEKIELLSERLDKVTIEHLDWSEILKRYDSPDTCFFIDPPYTTGNQQFYTRRWREDDHRELRDALLNIEGTFLLTYDDSSFVRDMYRGMKIRKVSQRKGINHRSKIGQMHQVIITRK